MKICSLSSFCGALAVVTLVGLMSAQAPQQALLFPKSTIIGPIPERMVQISEGSSFLVPTNRHFVLTGFALSDSSGQNIVTLSVDGAPTISGNCSEGVGRVVSVPFGIAVPAGKSVSVGSTPAAGFGVALGYLD